MQLGIGQIYADKYRIVRALGQGAMGAVYEAENLRIQRRVAIKILHPAMLHKRDPVTRFEREAQAAGRIGSRHIVEVLDVGELPDGTRFMVMEYLEGVTLEQRIRQRGRLAPEEIAPIAMQLLDGLAAAHEAGIVHRDLKPANVFLVPTRDGDFVKVLDFGVSKFNVGDAGEAMSMTSTGAVLGTPFYMSPEQAKGSRGIDARSDLYSVGVILYESITGQVPFSAETFNELIFRIVLESPPPAEQFVPNLDPGFALLLRKAMGREPEQRFQSALDFRLALRAWYTAQSSPMDLAQGGTVMMPGARGATLMLDDPRGGPPLPAYGNMTEPLRMPVGPGGPMQMLAMPHATVQERRSSRAMMAVVLLTAASVSMGGAAGVLLLRGGPASAASVAASAGASAGPAARAAASASPAASASAPAGDTAAGAPASSSGASAPETARAAAPSPAPATAAPAAPRPPAVAAEPSADRGSKPTPPPAPRPAPPARAPAPAATAAAAAPAPAPAPAPAAPASTKRTISGDL